MDRVDLNADLGEGYGIYACGDDEALLATVSSANIACGFHAGDAATMRRTVDRALALGVAAGAHPGLPDLAGFGRRDWAYAPSEAWEWIVAQVGALAAFAAAAGGRLRHVKPHGALYNRAARDRALAEAVADAVRRVDPALVLVGLAGSELPRAGRAAGLRVAEEAFADRAYADDGALAPRSLPGARIEDPAQAARQAVRIVREGLVRTLGGREIAVRADTICVHGDTPGAAAAARALRRALEAEGIAIRGPAD